MIINEEIVAIKIHPTPQTKLSTILEVLGEAPNDEGFTPNPGWWITIELNDKTHYAIPFRVCMAGLGISEKK